MSCTTTSNIAAGVTDAATVMYMTDPEYHQQQQKQPSQQQQNTTSMSMEEMLKQRAKIEDQVDYQFIQRIIQEVTQSCALNLPIPASAIPPLILQAAQYFWQNCDFAIEERYYCVKNCDFNRCGPNTTIKLPPQIISVFGVHKITDSFNYGVLGDFSLERMIINNSLFANGYGTGNINGSSMFNNGTGYTLMDVTAALYEVQTYKSLFDVPLTFNYNMFSNDLVILGDLGQSDLLLQTWKRLKIQDLYKNYYFFLFCVAKCLRSMGTIMGTFEFKLPGGVTLNYSRFNDIADKYEEDVKEFIEKNQVADYMITANSI